MTGRRLFAWVLALVLVGCGGGNLGATPGGAQDMALAREKINAGIVPEPEDFVAEGLYSEHDLPLEGPACEQVLCLRTATGIATAIDTGRQEAFVQVGFLSNVDAATFHRKPLDVSLVIDRSGSMDGTPIDAVKEAARRLVGKLNENDTFSLVLFDTQAETVLAQTAVSDRARLLKAIDGIKTQGGTCIECGLRLGYEQLASRQQDEGRGRRLFLFTDAQPNVGATGDGEFMTLVQSNSEHGLDLTVFGVNIAFDQALIARISSVRGANSFFLNDSERIKAVFDEDFDFLVTPIAYDLKMALTPAPGFRVAAVYGIPGTEPGQEQTGLEVATVFLSQRRGAILVRLAREGELPPQQPVVTGQFSYREQAGATSNVSLTASYDGSEPLASTQSWYSQQTVRKTVALTNFILGARRASELWKEGQKTEARAMADRTVTLLEAEAERLDDAPLRTEAALARKLAALMTP